MRAALQAQAEEAPLSKTPQPGDELILNGVCYRYDGSTGDGDHFTRMDEKAWKQALVSLKRGSAEARWLPVRVQLPPEAAMPLAGKSSPIEFRIERLAHDDQPARVVNEKSTFLVPR